MSIPTFGITTGPPASTIVPDSTFRWATVIASDPLEIQLDGDDTPLAITPDTLIGGPPPGVRVWCHLYGRRIIVLGISKGSSGGGGGGTDEVWIGPTLPTDPGLELWYDTSQQTPGALTGPEGPPGPSLPSSDAGNAIIVGTDGLLYTTPRILVLGPTDPVPPGTIIGTVIVRTR